MTLIHLYKTRPWYEAGFIFGFKGAGLGINKEILDNCPEDSAIEFEIKGKKNWYYITTQRVKELAAFYSSYHRVGGKLVVIVPLGECVNRDIFDAQHRSSLFNPVDN